MSPINNRIFLIASACAHKSLRSVLVALSALVLATEVKTLRNDLRFPALVRKTGLVGDILFPTLSLSAVSQAG